MNVLETAEAAFDAAKKFFTGESEEASGSKHHRHKSFAPIRQSAHVNWYVDGKDYFLAISEAISHAKEEIFIEDWWLSPELYLRRPPAENEKYRLDNLLQRKAEEGVKVYVVLYKEMPKALTLNSEHSKKSLQSKHENIVVQRHPDHFDLGGTLFWAHHEKICVIDRHIAFIGGLDLCFGRYDTHDHQVTDYHKNSNDFEIWPGQDYSNPRIKDFMDVEKWLDTLIDRKSTARMPWHDVSIGIVGRPVQDVARHFIQRWNFIKKEKAENRHEATVLVDESDAQHDRENPPKVLTYDAFGKAHRAHHYQGSCNVQILRSSAKWSHGLKEKEQSIQNAYIETIQKAKHFIYIENQFFITATSESDEFPVKNLIGKAIVERVIRAAKEKQKFRIIVIMPLLPAFPAEVETSDAGTLRLIMHYQYASICRGGHSIFDLIKKAGYNPEDYISFFSLRSHNCINTKAVEKALGSLKDTPSQEAEKWKTTGHEPAVPHSLIEETGNFVTEELYIHTKLLIADDRVVIIGSANLNDRSQVGDHDSEIAAIIEDTATIPSYLAGEPHPAAKFAVTLRRAIFKEHLGLVEDSVKHGVVTSNAHPPPHPMETTELTDLDRIVKDPASDEFYKYWLGTAKANTEAYRAVFKCVPDDTVTTWEEYEKFRPTHKKLGHVAQSDLPVEEVKSKLSKIKGHLVQFPTKFLEKEKLEGSVVFDAVTPMELFT